jgi:hypothetical protein
LWYGSKRAATCCIDHLFGIVGFPVTPIAAAAQKEGVAYAEGLQFKAIKVCGLGRKPTSTSRPLVRNCRCQAYRTSA